MRGLLLLSSLVLLLTPMAASADVALPGSAFFPEGIAVTNGGTFFVGSFVNGDIETYDAGDTTTTTFATGVLTRAVGLLADEGLGVLWACGTRQVDVPSGPGTFVTEAQEGIQGFDLQTGAPLAFHLMGEGSFCNDLAQDPEGNLYVTDSTGFRVVRVDANDRLLNTPAETWLEDPLFVLAPGEGTGLSLNGIAYVERSANNRQLFIVNISRGELYKVRIRPDGRAGQVTNIHLDRPLNLPDGLEAFDRNTLVVVENGANALTRVELRGNNAITDVLETDLNTSPTTFVDFNGDFVIVLGQLDILFGFNPNPPTLPFRIVNRAQPECTRGPWFEERIDCPTP